MSLDALYLASCRDLWRGVAAQRGEQHRDALRYLRKTRAVAAEIIGKGV